MKDLTGKIVVITGGGSGIGRGTALLLASRGATVAVGDLNEETAARTADDIAAGGGRASAHQANLVNTCSFAGLMGMTEMSPYNVSKFGVRGLTEALQMEFNRTPLTVTLVSREAPGRA